MQISVKYFASLRELIGEADDSMDVEDNATVKDVWQSILSKHQIDIEQVMMTVNHEYVKPDHTLKTGDEVAFFPPVTGG